ncbi:MAG: MotA/TolQ/ExbB proton channel family protein [Bdellovibrionales bacterium]
MQKFVIPASLRPYMRAPLIGAAFAGLMVLSPIAAGGHIFLLLFSIGGLIVVVGGVVTVAFMSYETAEVHKALDAIRRLFREPRVVPSNSSLQADVTAIMYCAKLVKEKGMRDLETMINKIGIRDPFIKYGLEMVVSDYSAEDVRSMLETAAETCFERDNKPVEILSAMASHAPAFGMVGTLVGMVAMLCSLSDDVSGVGPSLAVAFLSTLYGVLSARMAFMPAASNIKQEVMQRRSRNYLITEGMVMLVSRRGPMYVQDRLNSFMHPHSYEGMNSGLTLPPRKLEAA